MADRKVKLKRVEQLFKYIRDPGSPNNRSDNGTAQLYLRVLMLLHTNKNDDIQTLMTRINCQKTFLEVFRVIRHIFESL
jgi:hypothetical protein